MGQAGFTQPGSDFPQFINVRFGEGRALVSIRSAAFDVAATDAMPAHRATHTASIVMTLDEWDQWVAAARVERQSAES